MKITMFKEIKKGLISRNNNLETLRSELVSDITSLGDVGVECALKLERAPTELAIDRLDTIRIKGEDNNMTFVSSTASRQIDRIMEAKHDW
jgi:hypothetical protein